MPNSRLLSAAEIPTPALILIEYFLGEELAGDPLYDRVKCELIDRGVLVYQDNDPETFLLVYSQSALDAEDEDWGRPIRSVLVEHANSLRETLLDDFFDSVLQASSVA